MSLAVKQGRYPLSFCLKNFAINTFSKSVNVNVQRHNQLLPFSIICRCYAKDTSSSKYNEQDPTIKKNLTNILDIGPGCETVKAHLSSMGRWFDKVALVTGASGVIGSAVTVKLAQRGMKCVNDNEAYNDRAFTQRVSTVQRNQRVYFVIYSVLTEVGYCGIPQGTRQEEGMASNSNVDVEGTDDEDMEDQGQEGGPFNTNPKLPRETDKTFEPVSGLKRKLRTRPGQEVPQSKDIKVNNKFASLSSLQDETATSQTGQPSGGMKEGSTPRRIKTPPVVVTNATQYNNVINLLNCGFQDDYKVYCIEQGINGGHDLLQGLLHPVKATQTKHVRTLYAQHAANYRNYPIYLRELEKKNQVSEKKKEGESKVASPSSHLAGNCKPATGQQSSASKPTPAGNMGLNQPSYSGVIKKLANKDKQEDRSTDESSDLKDLLQILKEINVVGFPQLLRNYLVRLKNAPDKTTKERGVGESLNILFWNANGIAQQEHEFRQLLGTYGVNVALICETHLSEQKKVWFYGYKLYRNDRTVGRGGGATVLVRSNHVHYQTTLPAMDYIESTSIAIPTGWRQIVFTAVYRSHAVTFTIDDLDRLT
uniref:(California timema) hypothetical protein n=1 Tax=Timema californicum TaxID=61474 RepID=A0A7R9JEP8_TIMCA|nr:unnamed protein product [Timema californicum]